MGDIRPLVRSDIPEVVELYGRVFGPQHKTGFAQGITALFYELFCENPWSNGAPSSVVYEDNGRITGCLGVMPRPMSLGGQPIRAAVLHHFMVHPQARGRTGLQLLKSVFSGPQDLFIAEGNESSRKVWEGFGGKAPLSYGLRWTRPLRPSQYVLSYLKHRGLPVSVGHVLAPLCHGFDKITSRLSAQPFRPIPNRTFIEELNEDGLLACLSEVSACRSLRPVYDKPSLKWLIERLAQKKDAGIFQKGLVRGENLKVLGWFLYYRNPNGISQVVQIGAKPGFHHEVLERLFYDAWQSGSVAVSGQLDPATIHEFRDKYCIQYLVKDSCTLAHTRRPEVADAINQGDAFLTRLEVEWWI